MKNNKVLLLLFLFSLLVALSFFGAIKTQSITFQVCDVKKATSLIRSPNDTSMTYQEVVINKTIKKRNWKDRKNAILKDTSLNNEQKLTLLKDASYQPENVPVRKMEAIAMKNVSLIQTDFHPFMATMHLAYANHYPMTISPDMIWLLIAQGFAIHVNQNGEKMRNYFVDFKGKKDINVRRPFRKGNPYNDWPGVFEEFSEKIEANTGATLLDLVTGDFSTTGPIEKAAFQVTLMDAMKSYFTYSVTTHCGIPEITLEGTPADWKKIESKAQELAQYDLEWWIDDLLPILKEFTKAASGEKPNKDFWESIYKWKTPGSGSAYITGWILKFFPYKQIRDEFVQFKGNISRKTIYTPKRTTDELTDSLTRDKITKSDFTTEITYNLKATTDQLTSGLSQADFLWDWHGHFYEMEFVAGFVGCQQNPTTLSLRPEISWAVIDKQMKPTAEEIEAYGKGGDKEYLKSKNE